MTKQELISGIAKEHGIKAEVVEAIVEATIERIQEEVDCGGYVAIRGFGTFRPTWQPAKVGRDVKRGLTLNIPARWKPGFVVSKTWRKLGCSAPRTE